MTSPGAPRLPPPGPRLRGPIFLARFEYVRREHGPGMVEAVLQALDPSDRGALRGVDRRGGAPRGPSPPPAPAIAAGTRTGRGAASKGGGAATARPLPA